jgi:hypothetical protein
MRLCPGGGSSLERFVLKEGATLCGVNLPDGTGVGIAAPVIHHIGAIYGSDADEFRPSDCWNLTTPSEK